MIFEWFLETRKRVPVERTGKITRKCSIFGNLATNHFSGILFFKNGGSGNAISNDSGL